MAGALSAKPRPEYPRPQFRRSDWLSLNGWWEFEQDPQDEGTAQGWHHGRPLAQRILVPYPVESRLSGIGDRMASDVVWYRRAVAIPPDFASRSRLRLHFGAVDYRADVWWNGQYLGHHEGGHTPFHLEVPASARRGAPGEAHELVLRAVDHRERAQPRGKQHWEPESEAIFYTRTTGIWQSVWLEPLADTYIDAVRCTPTLADGSVRFRLALGGAIRPDLVVEVSVWDPDGRPYGTIDIPADGRELDQTLTALGAAIQPWSPEAPNLYAVRYRLQDGGRVVDEVESYLGFRHLEARGGQLFFNGQPYFLKMVLDQGYFPDGVLTAPSAEDLRRDVELTKALGFNGARKHQKLEDPQWLYWCDRLGLMAWGEAANAWAFTPHAVHRFTREWAEAVARDINHPALVAWVPINESWGVPDLACDPAQRAFVDALSALTKAWDPSRLVVSNDGWEHTGGDLATVHDYEGNPETLRNRYARLDSVLAFRPSGRALYVPGVPHRGEPVLVTEMGGLSLKPATPRDAGDWGYTTLDSAADLLARYRAQVEALAASPLVQGFCYTQLTDVEQEVNGLLTDRREPKVPLSAVWQANQLGR